MAPASTSLTTAHRLARLLNEHHSLKVEILERNPVGAHGAHLARLGDGRVCVLKWFAKGTPGATNLDDAVARVTRLRAKGYPIPEHGPVLAVPGHLILMQERVGGCHATDLTHAVVDRIFALNELQASDSDPARSWSRFLPASVLAGSVDGEWCLHEPLRRHSPATRALLDRITSVAAAVDGVRLPDGDAVHLDFHHENLLVDDGSLRSVIDWNDSRTGDRIFDLVTLAFVASCARTELGVVERIWRHAATKRDGAVLATYVAHMALRYLDWFIRWHPAQVESWLVISHRYLDMAEA